MRVLTYSMRQARAQELIALTSAAGAEARGLVTVAALARLDRATDDVATAIVDVGHEHTHVVIARHGKPQWSRSLTRGGRHVTDAVVKNWRLGFAEAEHAKHTDGFVASSGNPAPSEAWQRVHEVLITELGPWVRELRQSLAAARAKTGLAVGRVILVGGGSRLRGLSGFVADELRLPVATISATDAAAFLAPAPGRDRRGRWRRAGHRHRARRRRRSRQLRSAAGRAGVQGRHDLREDQADAGRRRRAGGAGVRRRLGLRVDEDAAQGREDPEPAGRHRVGRGLRRQAQDRQGAAVAVGGTGGAGESPMPKMSAYDLLLEINGKLPARDKITLNVTSIDIKDNKVSDRGLGQDARGDRSARGEGAVKGISCVKESRPRPIQERQGRREAVLVRPAHGVHVAMAAFDKIRDKWESISPRERTLVVLLGVSFVVVMILFVALSIKDGLDRLEAKNEQSRTALRRLTAYRATARTVVGNDPTALIPVEAIKLESYIYKAGEAAKVVVPGVNPRTPTSRGKFMVHAASVEIRDLTITQVKDFLRRSRPTRRWWW
jgi:hypothetical protein